MQTQANIFIFMTLIMMALQDLSLGYQLQKKKIKYITNGQGISREDAIRITNNLTGEWNSPRIGGRIADYLFEVSGKNFGLGSKSGRFGNSEPGTYSRNGKGSAKNGIERSIENGNKIYGFHLGENIGIFTEEKN